MSLQDFDIVVLTETWLNGSIYDSELFDDRYVIYRRDRESSSFSTRKTGGGVLIAVAKHINSCRMPHLESQYEDLWVSIDSPGKGKNKTYICGVYLPPPITLESTQTFLESAQIALDQDERTLIVGDFNLSTISWVISEDRQVSHTTPYTTHNNDITKLFLDYISMNDLGQYNYLTNNKSRTLDLVLSNTTVQDLKNCCTHMTQEDPLHPPLEFSLSINDDTNCLKTKPTTKPNFFKADYVKILTCLMSVDWDTSFADCSSVDEMVNILYEILHDVIKQHVPLKTISRKDYPAWYTPKLKKLLQKKNKFRVKMKKYNNPLDAVYFETLRANCSKLRTSCYRNYIERLETAVLEDPKIFWSFIKNKRKSSSSYPAVMCHKEKAASNGHDICNLFAENFASVYNNTKVPHPSNFNKNNNLPSFCRLELNSTEVFRTLTSLDEHKSVGDDGIPPVFIKRCAKALALPLTIIYNKSLKDGIFPEQWKKALVVPIFKAGERKLVSNYRPISMLVVFGKVFEKLITEHLSSHVKHLISANQHGFIKSRSTTTNLMCYVSSLSESVDKRIPVDTIYTDFSKAFDKVDHYLLIAKLQHLGIGGSMLEWFQSYLSGRSSKVVMGGHSSKPFNATSGVPQGSHLGPILFNIFINDITQCFIHSKFYLFADDMKIMKPIVTEIDSALLQEDLNRLMNWCKNNNMLLNVSKCYYIQFSRNKNVKRNVYTIGQQKLEQADQIRDLGVTLDKQLKFDKHILQVSSKGFKILGFILRNSKDFKKASTRVKLFNTLVRPILEYSSPVWNPHYDIYIKHLESVQRRFLYHLCYKDRLAKIITTYKDRLKHYNMVPLAGRRKTADLTLLHKIFNGAIDCSELLEKLNLNAPSRLPRKSSYNLLHVPGSKTNLGHFATLPRLCRQYNELSKHFNLDITLPITKFKKFLSAAN